MNIPKTMKAMVKAKEGPGAELMEMPVPKVGPGEVLVKVKACAICGTDIHMYQWNAWAQENVAKAYSALPRIMGHEFSGEVVALGEDVDGVALGQRIAAETHIPCGECYLCKTGYGFNCQHVKRFKNGIYAEYALIPACSCVKVPENISDEEAATMEPLSVAIHGVANTSVVGDTVAIVGAGPIGLYTIKLAKAMGASKIFATDISDYRLDLAKKAGADVVLNPNTTDVVQEIRAQTNGLGAGTVFEISGNVKATKQAFEMLRKSGTMIMTGLPSEPLVLDAGGDIVWKAAKIYGVHGRQIFNSWETATSLLGAGVIEIESIITHRFSLFSEYDEAFKLAEAGLTGKVVLYPQSL